MSELASLSRPVGVGFVGAGSVLWAYLQLLDRLIPRGLAVEGPIWARRRETWPELLRRRPAARLVSSLEEVLVAEVDVVVVLTPPESHADLTQLAPTFRALWTQIIRGAIGRVHSARGLYGNAGSPWAAWYHSAGVGPLAENGIYNLKSLTSLLGPVTEVMAAEATAVPVREAGGRVVDPADPDVAHTVLRHASGALSSLVSSQAMQRYRRPALELYGTEGTANLLGDDWDPRGFEIWRNELARWEEHEAIDGTWLWADGLRECVMALREGRAPLQEPQQELHLLDVVDAARVAIRERRAVEIGSSFPALDLTLELPIDLQHVHDHTRPLDEQT